MPPLVRRGFTACAHDRLVSGMRQCCKDRKLNSDGNLGHRQTRTRREADPGLQSVGGQHTHNTCRLKIDDNCSRNVPHIACKPQHTYRRFPGTQGTAVVHLRKTTVWVHIPLGKEATLLSAFHLRGLAGPVSGFPCFPAASVRKRRQ